MSTNKTEESALDAVARLNQIIYEAGFEDVPPFEYQSDGTSEAVEFYGLCAFNSNDDERIDLEEVGAGDGLEPFEDLFLRKMETLKQNIVLMMAAVVKASNQ